MTSILFLYLITTRKVCQGRTTNKAQWQLRMNESGQSQPLSSGDRLDSDSKRCVCWPLENCQSWHIIISSGKEPQCYSPHSAYDTRPIWIEDKIPLHNERIRWRTGVKKSKQEPSSTLRPMQYVLRETLKELEALWDESKHLQLMTMLE